MTCDCIKKMNAALAAHNTQLSTGLTITPDGRGICQLQIATCKVDSSLRRKPVLAIASFCPFCGTKAAS